MSARAHFRYPPRAPLAQPAPLTRKQIVLLILGWTAAMAGALFLLTPAGRALLALVWGAGAVTAP